MPKTLRIGTRPSRLAIKQVEEIKSAFPLIAFEIVPIITDGDMDKTTPVSEVEGSDFFTRQIDRALLEGFIDMAVHSSKDLSDVLTKGLSLVFETSSISPFDALVSRGHKKLNELPAGWRIGTSSIRRKSQIKTLRKDLNIADIRGTIEERLGLIDTGIIDALIVAHAALIRMGLEERISEIFGLNIFDTHPKQGSLSILAREKECERVRFILSGQARATGT